MYWERRHGWNSETPGPCEIWWSDPQGTEAELLFSEKQPIVSFRVYGRASCTPDGSKLLVQHRDIIDGKQVWTVGWMGVPDGKFELVLPASVFPTSIAGPPDGSKLLFVHQGQIFEWTPSDKK